MARSAVPTRGSENRLFGEIRISRGERTRRSRAPTTGITQCCPYLGVERWGG